MPPHSARATEIAKPTHTGAAVEDVRALWAIPVVLAAVVVLIYAPSLRFGFVYDDRVQILSNAWLKSWRFLPQYFTQPAAAFGGLARGGAFWRPLFLVWLKLNQSFFGLQPMGWHLDAVLLHASVTGLVYALVWRLLRDRMSAVFAALLFGVYPATIETAAWISGSTDSLMAVFLLSSFLLFLRAREERQNGISIAALLAFAAALLTKETAIILPVLIFSYVAADSSHLAGAGARVANAARAAAPFAVLALVYGAARTLVLHGHPPAPDPNTTREMVLTWPALVLFYLRLLVFPAPVSPHYDVKSIGQFSAGHVLLPMLVLLAVAAVLGLLWRRFSRRLDDRSRRAIWFAVVWIIIPILPVLYIRPMARDDFAHVRYLYVSTIGYAVLLTILLSRIRWGRALNLARRPWTQVAIAIILTVICAVATSRAQLPWSDNLSLFACGARVAPRNANALTDLAIEVGSRRHYDEALELFHRALRLNPDLWYTNLDLGYTYLLLDRYAEAETYVERAVGIAPYAPEEYGVLARIELKLGKVEKAIWALRKGIEYAPREPGYHYALALILQQQGQTEAAAKELQAVLAIDAAYADARARLAAIANSGRQNPR